MDSGISPPCLYSTLWKFRFLLNYLIQTSSQNVTCSSFLELEQTGGVQDAGL